MVHGLGAVHIIHPRSCLYVPHLQLVPENCKIIYSLRDKTAQTSSLLKDTKTDPHKIGINFLRQFTRQQPFL